MLSLTTSDLFAFLFSYIVGEKNGLTKTPQLAIMLQTAILFAVFVSHVTAVNNGLARVPQLGWVRQLGPFVSRVLLGFAHGKTRTIGTH